MLNATSPSLNLLGSLARRSALRRCAPRRAGRACTSVACIEPERSVASITVACCLGDVSTTRAGRAIAITSAASASRKSSGGTWRRHSACGDDVLEQVEVREAHGVAAAPPLREQRTRSPASGHEREAEEGDADQSKLTGPRLRLR